MYTSKKTQTWNSFSNKCCIYILLHNYKIMTKANNLITLNENWKKYIIWNINKY